MVTDECMNMEHEWNSGDSNIRKYSEKTCPSFTVSTTNST